MSETEKKETREAVKPKKRQLLNSPRMRMLLAIALAILCWTVVTNYIAPNTQWTYRNIPVNFSYNSSKFTSMGLSIVNDPQYSVSVVANGDGSVLGGLTSEDFTVYPDYSAVRGSGEATLGLLVICNNTNVTVALGNKDDTVDIVFDTVSELTLPITVATKDLTMEEGFILNKAATVPGEVTLTGPTGELENVAQAVAVASVNGALGENVTVGAKLEFLDDEDNVIDFIYASCDTDAVEVALTVYKLAEIPISVSFINTPEGFDASVLKYSLSQQMLKVAGPAATIDTLRELNVGTLDLSTFALDKVYELNIQLPTGIVSQENVQAVSVSFDSTGLVTKTMNLPASCVEVVNLPSTYQLTVESERIMNVTVCGPADVLDGLTAQSLVARINADEFSIVTGQQNIAVSLYAPSSGQVFAIGTYTVQCRIESN